MGQPGKSSIARGIPRMWRLVLAVATGCLAAWLLATASAGADEPESGDYRPGASSPGGPRVNVTTGPRGVSSQVSVDREYTPAPPAAPAPAAGPQRVSGPGPAAVPAGPGAPRVVVRPGGAPAGPVPGMSTSSGTASAGSTLPRPYPDPATDPLYPDRALASDLGANRLPAPSAPAGPAAGAVAGPAGGSGATGPGGPARVGVPSGAAPRAAPDPRRVALQVRDHVPLPDVRIGANPTLGLVGLSSWFWVENYDGRPFGLERRVEVPPVVDPDVPTDEVPANDPRRRPETFTVAVTVRPSRYEWSFGDGTTLLTPSLGKPYPAESDVQHTYEHSSLQSPNGFPVRLTIEFAAEYRVNGGAPQPLPPLRRTYEGAHRVQEIQPVLTGR